MKKITLMMIATLLICLLSGCSNLAGDRAGAGSDGDGAHITLALRDGTYADVIEECLSHYEADHNVTCEVLRLSEADLHDQIAEAGKEGGVDLCMVDGSWIAEFASEGYLADLYDLGYSLDDDIIDATTDISYYNGNLYVTPYYGNVTVLLFNKDLIEQKAGKEDVVFPTLDDVMTASKSLAEQGKMGFLYRGDTENNVVVDFMPFLLSFGGWVVDDNNQPTVNTPEFRDALTYYMELISTGGAMPKEELIEAIDSGEAGQAVAWPGWYTPNDESAAEYVALPGKIKDGSVAYNANVYGVWMLGIAENSENKESAVALLKYLMDPDVQKSTIDLGGVPCRYSCLQDSDILHKYPYFEQIDVALESGTYRPVMKEWNEFVTILGAHMLEILDGKVSVDEGLDAAQTELEALMQK